MRDELIQEETAKLDKVKGFDNGCEYLWGEYEGYIGLHHADNYNRMNTDKQFSAPRQELLHKWLREEHRMVIIMTPHKTQEDTVMWFSQVFTLKSYNMTFKSFNYISMFEKGDTYEEALEGGLKAALKLIKI